LATHGLEGALKLKELTYLHAEVIRGRVEARTTRLDRARSGGRRGGDRPAMHEKILSNLAEVKARGASVVAVATDDDDPSRGRGLRLRVPATEPMFTPMVDIVPLQLFAYFMARGLDATSTARATSPRP